MLPDVSAILPASGETATLIRHFDWASTALGPVADWPEPLRSGTRLMLTSPTPIVLMCGKQGVLIYNDAYALLAGERHPAILGQPVELAWPEIAEWNRQVLDTGLLGQSLSCENHHFILHRPGRPDDAWMNLYYSPLLDQDQQSHGVMCIAVENTSQVLAEHQRAAAQTDLHEARSRLELALSASAVIGTWVWDVLTDTMRGDERFARAFACEPAAVALGLPVKEFLKAIHPDDLALLRTQVRAVLENGGRFRSGYRLRQQDGQYRWVEAHGYCEVAANGRVSHFPGVLIDIDEHKRTEQALRQLTQSLEQRIGEAIQQRMQTEEQLRQVQKMEAIGQLTGGIAHDFNNILAAILGSLELSQRKLASGNPSDLPALLNSAVASANRGASLTHRLLAFARRQALDMRPTNINNLVGTIEELLRRTLGEQIRLETCLTSDPWLIRTDSHQLENALINLVINARDAMPNGGLLTIETCNRTLADKEANALDMPAGDYLCLSVRDNGIGMDAEVTRHVFEPFFTTKPIGLGTGLGLPMVYGFIKQAGGHLQLSSAPGLGTRVDLYLPRFDHPAPDEEPARLTVTPRGTGESVLLVEDDPVVRMLIAETLTELGYRLVQTADGREALEVLASAEPLDLLLTDVGLPGMNGRQLAEAARQLRPRLPVLFATGYAHDAQARDGNLGPNMAIIAKPFSLEQLGSKVRTMLEG